MKVARFVLKIVALSLTTAAVVCAVIAYWDKVAEFCGCAGEKLRKKTGCPSEYDDYVEGKEDRLNFSSSADLLFALGRGRMACTPHGVIAPALAEQGAVGKLAGSQCAPLRSD